MWWVWLFEVECVGPVAVASGGRGSLAGRIVVAGWESAAACALGWHIHRPWALTAEKMGWREEENFNAHTQVHTHKCNVHIHSQASSVTYLLQEAGHCRLNSWNKVGRRLRGDWNVLHTCTLRGKGGVKHVCLNGVCKLLSAHSVPLLAVQCWLEWSGPQ